MFKAVLVFLALGMSATETVAIRQVLPAASSPVASGSSTGIGLTRRQVLMIGSDMSLPQPEISWGTNATHIEIQMTYPTTGWMALGLSVKGGMDQSDVLFAYVDDKNGEVVVQDRIISAPPNQTPNPALDAQQDWTAVSGSQNITHTTVRARRKLQTCDPADRPFVDATVPVIYSYHTSDPLTKTTPITKHVQRGGSRLNYLSAAPVPPPTERIVSVLNVTMGDAQIIPKKTLYYCRMTLLPTFSRDLHAVMVTPILDPRNTDLIHHMDLLFCDKETPTVSGERFECGLDNPAGVQLMKYCTMYAGWATGAGSDVYPPEAGLPFSPDMSGKYVILQTHFNNPALRGGMDNSGFSFSLTDRLRKFDIGGLITGFLNVDFTMTIPRGQEAFQFVTQCSDQCSKFLPKEGINIISAIVHMHTRGRIGVIRHFRGAQELPPIIQDMSYNYNFQTPINISPPRNFLPGDRLVTECTFSTKDDQQDIFGGESTTEEMCMGFITYYGPKTTWTTCAASYNLDGYLSAIEMPDNQIVQSGLVTKPGQSVLQAIISQDQDALVQKLENGVISYAQNYFVNAIPTRVAKLQQFYKSKQYVGVCDASGKETTIPKDTPPVIPPFQSSDTPAQSC